MTRVCHGAEHVRDTRRAALFLLARLVVAHYRGPLFVIAFGVTSALVFLWAADPAVDCLAWGAR